MSRADPARRLRSRSAGSVRARVARPWGTHAQRLIRACPLRNRRPGRAVAARPSSGASRCGGASAACRLRPSRRRSCGVRGAAGEGRRLRCVVCERAPVDPAHLVPQRLGGCAHPDCVVPLCRTHHRLYDHGALRLGLYLGPPNRPNKDVPVAVTVIDIHGNVVLTHRMTGAPAFSLELAERKAYTSACAPLTSSRSATRRGPLSAPRGLRR
jgi:hypothetical protein